MTRRVTIYAEGVKRVRKTSYGRRTFVAFDHDGDTVQLDVEALFDLLAILTTDDGGALAEVHQDGTPCAH